MKKIFLCCAAGMSTSMVVNKMKQAAAQKGIEAEIIAVAMEEFDNTLPKYDCCLLGPQIKYKFEEFKKKAEAAGKPTSISLNPKSTKSWNISTFSSIFIGVIKA